VWISMRPCMQYLCPMSTVNYENCFNVTISALLETRHAVKADRKWRCKQIYSNLEGLYWWVIFSNLSRNSEEIFGLTSHNPTLQYLQAGGHVLALATTRASSSYEWSGCWYQRQWKRTQVVSWKVRKLGHRPVSKNTGYSVCKQMFSKHHFTDS